VTARTWIVRVSRFPLHLPGAELGRVTARDYEHADELAADAFPRPFTIEPAPARENAQLDTALAKAITTRAKKGGYVRHDWPRRARRNTGRQEDR
jgi:hypothetical protein